MAVNVYVGGVLNVTVTGEEIGTGEQVSNTNLIYCVHLALMSINDSFFKLISTVVFMSFMGLNIRQRKICRRTHIFFLLRFSEYSGK